MTNKEFFDEIVTAVRDSMDRVHKVEDKLADRKRQVASGIFAKEYVQQELEPEVRRLERKLLSEKDAASEQVRKKCDEYIAELRADEELNPADLTDDIRLLQMGVSLTERDMRSLLERNKDNATMLQVLLRYAREHDLPTGDVHYIGNAPTIRMVNTLAESAQTALKWSSNYSVFDRLLGEDSDLARAFEGGAE